MDEYLQTTDDGDVVFEVEEETGCGFLFSGCNILNHASYLFTMSSFEPKVSLCLNLCLQNLW